ncbi:50S ribosomal protein L25/general stress protein Ctc [Rummeliibacillus pycnus]|uniref:50S ribosomal protein L25/general stress protein Ctc n=1 Tax=Rummeliibacillus pycnus TaxID=101070 RepID=UPI0037CA8837
MITVVHAKKREVGKRSVMSAIRKNGFVPAVVYGYQTESTPIAINAREFEKMLRKDGKNAIVTLDIEGKEIKAVIKDIQRDSLKDKLVHLDFFEVNMSALITVKVPVIVKGQAIGVIAGGILQQPNRMLKLSTKPSDIPENIEVDVSNLAIGDTLTIGDIRDQVNYKIASSDSITLVTISVPVIEIELESSSVTDADKAV